MVVDLTEHSLLFTCYECTIEQGPSLSTLGHLQLRLWQLLHSEAKVPFNGANPSSVRMF
jgi:hypothetical protein